MTEFKEQMKHRIQENMTLFKAGSGLYDPAQVYAQNNSGLQDDFA